MRICSSPRSGLPCAGTAPLQVPAAYVARQRSAALRTKVNGMTTFLDDAMANVTGMRARARVERPCPPSPPHSEHPRPPTRHVDPSPLASCCPPFPNVIVVVPSAFVAVAAISNTQLPQECVCIMLLNFMRKLLGVARSRPWGEGTERDH